MKLIETQQLFNFKNGLRLNHQQKLKNLSKKIDLQNLFDQIINFKKEKSLNKAHKKNKHFRDVNSKKQKNN